MAFVCLRAFIVDTGYHRYGQVCWQIYFHHLVVPRPGDLPIYHIPFNETNRQHSFNLANESPVTLYAHLLRQHFGDLDVMFFFFFRDLFLYRNSTRHYLFRFWPCSAWTFFISISFTNGSSSGRLYTRCKKFLFSHYFGFFVLPSVNIFSDILFDRCVPDLDSFEQ